MNVRLKLENTGCTRCSAPAWTTNAKTAARWWARRTKNSTRRRLMFSWNASFAHFQPSRTPSENMKKSANWGQNPAPTANKRSKLKGSWTTLTCVGPKRRNVMNAPGSSAIKTEICIWLKASANSINLRMRCLSNRSSRTAWMNLLASKSKSDSSEKRWHRNEKWNSNLNLRLVLQIVAVWWSREP